MATIGDPQGKLKGLREKLKKEEKTRTLNLVDLLLQIVLKKPVTLVGHRFPDDDVWLCFWLAQKFLVPGAEIRYLFVNAGETLPESKENGEVHHFDTGGGKRDQHGRGRKKSSARRLAEELGLLENHLGLLPLLKMVDAVDNASPLPPTSIHFIVEGLPRHPHYRKPDGTNWNGVRERVFELFDIVYGQETQRIQSRNNLEKHCEWTTLPNGLKIAVLLGHPELRDAAFEQGAMVVVWTQWQGKNHFYTGIPRNRQLPRLCLDGVAAALRATETFERGIDATNKDLHYIGRGVVEPCWYLDESLALILNGSRTWKPEENEYTRLAPRRIVGIVTSVLSKIPKDMVSQWRNGR